LFQQLWYTEHEHHQTTFCQRVCNVLKMEKENYYLLNLTSFLICKKSWASRRPLKTYVTNFCVLQDIGIRKIWCIWYRIIIQHQQNQYCELALDENWVKLLWNYVNNSRALWSCTKPSLEILFCTLSINSILI